MRVDPKALIRRLDPACTQALEEAVARAAAGRYYEIVVEHLLLGLLAPESGEIAELFQDLGRERRRAAASIERVLQRLRTGNAGRPVIAEGVMTWIEEAWLCASVERGATHVGPGDLLLEFVVHASRYTAEPTQEIVGLPREDLRRLLRGRSGASVGTSEFAQGPASDPPSSVPGPKDRSSGTGSTATAGSSGAASSGAGEHLGRFTISLTERARQGEIDPVFGRDPEIRQMIDVLARRRKNNPILVGEPGVGKTAVVEGLARAIVAGEAPRALQGTELRTLDLGLLMAGAGVRGELEKRLKAVIAEVKASAVPIILFIDEAHTLMGGGGDGSDLANLLKPELARGELRTIAATTWSEYKKYFEKDAALARRFQPVKIDEPPLETVTLMLRGLARGLEGAHGVTIRDEAITAAVELGDRYIAGRYHPDKAVDLLDTAAARVKIEQDAPPEALVRLRSDLAAATFELDGLRRDLADGRTRSGEAALTERVAALEADVKDLEARWESEKAAIAAVVAAQGAYRATESGAPEARAAAREELDRARSSLAELGGESPLIHAEVDRAAIARIVADWTGIPVGKMKSASIAELLDLEARMQRRIRGQDGALRAVAEAVRMSFAGVRDPRTPIAVLLFVGPSGVGKTETALALADLLFGGERQMTTINMSEFQEKHTVSRLIGSPPGYVGYGEGGVLTEAVRQRPHSVVLLDECEKADLEVMNLFYQVFDKGTLSDGEGREIDFRQTILILTSNLATDKVMDLHKGDRVPDLGEVTEAIRPILSKHFKPALLARMTVVPYRPMSPTILGDIAGLKLRALGERLRRAHGLTVEFGDALRSAMVERCLATESGARTLDHVLRGSLMPSIARSILEELAGGALPPRMTIDWDGGWSVRWAR
ncbi:MAG: type VI secretion system ATPase TssH [Nannocystaceae bacterium]